MWKDMEDDVLSEFDFLPHLFLLAPSLRFPEECPACHARRAHIYLHRNRERRGGQWGWCSNCRIFFHGSGDIPYLWENFPLLDPGLLCAVPDYLEEHADEIDGWVNGLLQKEEERFQREGTDLCDACGAVLRGFCSDGCMGKVCDACGNGGWVTTYIDPIHEDPTRYALTVFRIEAPTAETLRTLSDLWRCNYLAARERIRANDVTGYDLAPAIRDIALRLKKAGIAFEITPPFPHEWE
jgi:hypothetical protein